MILRPNLLDQKYAANYLYAKELSAELERVSVPPQDLRRGDFVVVNFDSHDKLGEVATVKFNKTSATIFLDGEPLEVGANHPIYIIHRGATMELRDHTPYERDMHKVEKKDNEANYPHSTQDSKSIGNDKSSEFPSTKKLSFRQPNFKVGDSVISKGKKASIIEIIAAESIYKPMAVIQTEDGNINAEFISDLSIGE
jgi:hypothetical protein